MKALLVVFVLAAVGSSFGAYAQNQASGKKQPPYTHLKQIDATASETSNKPEDNVVAPAKPFVSDKKIFTIEPVDGGTESSEIKPAVSSKRQVELERSSPAEALPERTERAKSSGNSKSGNPKKD